MQFINNFSKLQKTILIFMLFCCGVVFATNGWAQTKVQSGLNIVFVDMQRIMRDSSKAKASSALIESEFSKKQQDLRAIESALKSDVEKFKRDAPTLSESQRIDRERNLSEQERKLQIKGQEFQEDLTRRRNEELKKVISSINDAIFSLAKSEKYDVVLQEAIYVDPKFDITDKVIKAMKAK